MVVPSVPTKNLLFRVIQTPSSLRSLRVITIMNARNRSSVASKDACGSVLNPVITQNVSESLSKGI